MRSLASLASLLLLSATLVLSGCGGGGEDDPGQPAAFDVGALVDGQPVRGIDVFPGEEQTLYVSAGQTFELDSSGPVDWTVVIGGQTIAGSGNTIDYAGATIQETLTTATRFAASTFADDPLAAPVQVILYATSRDDPDQTARINVVITN